MSPANDETKTEDERCATRIHRRTAAAAAVVVVVVANRQRRRGAQ
jgi:hypothetical protein